MLLGLLVHLVSSLKANRLLLNTALAAMLSNAALNYLFMRWMGVAGITLSTSVVQALTVLLLALLLFRRSRRTILTAC